jgi:RNA polymerase sigma factor (sigma-70 family)
MNAAGQAIGVLSTLAVAPLALSNGVGDLGREPSYTRAHSAFSGVQLVTGTKPFGAAWRAPSSAAEPSAKAGRPAGPPRNLRGARAVVPCMSPRADTPAADVAELVRAAAADDEAAWRVLVARYSGLVWSIARGHRLAEADVADVAQTTWLRLVEHVGRLEDPARVGVWLATTARRECLRTLSRAARQIPSSDRLPDGPCEAPDLDAGLLRDERDAALRLALASLAPRDQALLGMLVAEPPATYCEIGAALGMQVGSVGPIRRRCLERLQRQRERLDPAAAAAA